MCLKFVKSLGFTGFSYILCQLFITAAKTFVGDKDTKKALLLIAQSHLRAAQVAEARKNPLTRAHALGNKEIKHVENRKEATDSKVFSEQEGVGNWMADSVLGGMGVKSTKKAGKAVSEFLALEETLKRFSFEQFLRMFHLMFSATAFIPLPFFLFCHMS